MLQAATPGSRPDTGLAPQGHWLVDQEPDQHAFVLLRGYLALIFARPGVFRD